MISGAFKIFMKVVWNFTWEHIYFQFCSSLMTLTSNRILLNIWHFVSHLIILKVIRTFRYKTIEKTISPNFGCKHFTVTITIRLFLNLLRYSAFGQFIFIFLNLTKRQIILTNNPQMGMDSSQNVYVKVTTKNNIHSPSIAHRSMNRLYTDGSKNSA